MKKKGITIVFTGNGKGKTTAALGVALRASGRDMKTLMIQFIKEKGQSGEHNICPAILGNIEIYPFGMGFVFRGDDLRPHIEMAEQAWIFMEQTIKERKFDILILDELTIVLNLGLLTIEKVMDFLTRKSDDLHIIITGRDAPQELIEFADVVTEMTEIKHVYRKGVSAVKGLDY
ncbi:MAG: cob(I)yrinic acid a,c-diamide adenosyltransferase [Syntrophorhabdus aromaticivorans]|uniref:corrinoid adenosyltransferase n=1 Tax=Syntrophorhabdus aromaticivorans TaxID=328301 RepID=A0A971M4A1_9BACT|nr:cob(I)yrinic acid a,c-diamide adenosyltransferase [Syntrophorhabdus aromaticivorans]